MAAGGTSGRGLILLAMRSPPAQSSALPQVMIAVPTQINCALVDGALAQGLFLKPDVDVVNQPFDLGMDALKAVLDEKPTW